MHRTIIAVDPGKSGGIAIWPEGAHFPTAFAMPETDGDLVLELRTLKEASAAEPVAFIEQVTGFRPGRRQPGSHMFTFGENYGFIRAVLQTLGFRIELVRPQSWQRALGLGTSSGLEPRAWKTNSKPKPSSSTQAAT
jgi:hypothetical protein